VKKYAQPETPGYLHRGISGEIVDHETVMDAVPRDIPEGLFEGLAGIVGRHDHNYFRTVHFSSRNDLLPPAKRQSFSTQLLRATSNCKRARDQGDGRGQIEPEQEHDYERETGARFSSQSRERGVKEFA
jgi:hypothetical protein